MARDSFLTTTWRPFIGYCLGLYLSAQWLLPLVGKEAPTVDPQLMLVVGTVLGVASWFRGKAQVTAMEKGN
jgi:hypothetical protein